MVTYLRYKKRRDGKLKSQIIKSERGAYYYVVVDDVNMTYYIVNANTMRKYTKEHFEQRRTKSIKTGKITSKKVLQRIIRRHLSKLGVKFKVIISNKG